MTVPAIRCPVDSCPVTCDGDDDGTCDLVHHLTGYHHQTLDEALQNLTLVELVHDETQPQRPSTLTFPVALQEAS